ncbi:nucleoside-diphosphate sugar epimerase [candidate division MSBL1 archaeon SCGC-AAA385M11]|nr:nucleoside-diphosphate sugar epimerase [candidate division MSBL1 archaeon SCGC-AAA385M11]
MVNILVTGGTGFIGTNLTNELRLRGHEVWTLDIDHGEDERHFRVDVGSYQQLENVFRNYQFDFVYHLAAEYGRWNGEDHYENLWQTNVIGAKHLLRLQEKQGFKMIFFSSAEVYGDYDQLMTEDVMERIPIKQMNDYAISKWAGELQCLNHANMFGVEVVRVRPVNCYGPHEYYSPYRGVIPVFVYCCLKNKPFTIYKGHKRIFDYVDDTVRTVANIVDNFIPGEVYNVGSREDWEVRIEELAQIIFKETGADPNLAQVKGEEAFTTRVKVVDFSKSRRDLQHKAEIGLQEGIRRYVQWMRKAYS